MSDQVTGAGTAPLSRSIRRGDLVFLSGAVPIRPDGTLAGEGIEEQTEHVLRRLDEELRTHGGDRADIAKVTVLLADPDRDWAAMNKVYRAFFAEPMPARSAYGVHLAAEGLLVEIEAIAVLGG
ncbi:RidA family protein [Nocardioides sp. L-11A]|uniref:RidA family protein n=1 Tax=Nocardioides sp. L-11A TaxID=3043848 RepID=UPI00249C65E7|nr:RidA family protein [Nocardioides sp. L-11A]